MIWLERLFRRRKVEAQIDSELRFHVEQKAAELIASGVGPHEARRRAMAKLGGIEAIKQEYRESRSTYFLESILQDVRYAIRTLRKSPGFTVVAILTLALGIGANTAIFSVIDNIILKPVPFTASEQLVRIYSTKNGVLLNPNGAGNPGGPSVLDLRDFVQNNHTFQGMVAYDSWRKNVSFGEDGGVPEQMMVGLVPASFFKVLDVKPVMGRLFTKDESYVGKHYVAAISSQVWKTRYNSDIAIIGKKIHINGEPYTIVAVMPSRIPEWMDYRDVQIWTPFGFADARGDLWTEAGRRGRGWFTVGRMKAGVTIEQAQADLSTIAGALAATHPVDRGIGVQLEKLSDTRARNLRPMLFLLMGAVSLILLIACVNLANLLLAFNSRRQRELVMRAALGAGRQRLVRQLLAETLLLSVVGGSVGLFLAKIGIATLVTMRPAHLPQLSSIGIDWRVLLFTLLVSVLTSLIFGLVPALTASRLNLAESLKLGARSGTGGSGAQRMRNLLIVMETAMSLMLLIGAGLLIQSILRLQRQPLGIRSADHLLTGHFYLPPVQYPDPVAIARFSDQFADKVRALPGVLDASISTIWPPSYNWSQMFEIPGHPVTRAQEVPSAPCGFTDDHFLRTMGIPLIRGRDFNISDTATSPPVVLVSREFVRQYFPHEDPLGQRIHVGPPAFLNIPPGSDIDDSSDVTIIGVIGDFRNSGLALPPQPQIIALYSQHPLVTYGFRDIVVRTAADPHRMIPVITRQLHSMDAELPFSQTRTINDIVEQLTGRQRLTSALLGLFAAIGLVLAAVGVYGVVSFLVVQRQRELAVRIAVGASVGNVIWLVLKQGLRTILIAAPVGLLGTWAAHKLLSQLLFGISALDPLTFAGAALFLCAVVVIACWVPAWRGARVDPMLALRQE